ncbi:MAG: hypothetical protein WCW01_00945 [Gammaproteobacteria bacterium]|jgi:hypothetical protein
MVKDYARTNIHHRKPHRGFAVFISCNLLVLLLLFTWGGYYFIEHHKSGKVKVTSRGKQIEVKKSADVKKKEHKSKKVVKEESQSQYDFYTLLPKLKVSSGIKKNYE